MKQRRGLGSYRSGGPLVVTMAPPGSSRPSLTYMDQTLEASLPAITHV